MVMAAARTLARRRMGACETTPLANAPGTSTRPRISQTANEPSPPSMISRRLPGSSSFVLAAARLRALQLAPRPRGRKTRAAARKDPEEQSAQPDGARSHRARSVRPLDTNGPYGCRIEGVAPGRIYAQECIIFHGSGQHAYVAATIAAQPFTYTHRARSPNPASVEAQTPDAGPGRGPAVTGGGRRGRSAWGSAGIPPDGDLS